jgi:hypothetical protein
MNNGAAVGGLPPRARGTNRPPHGCVRYPTEGAARRQMSRADEFRQNADDCRRQAERSRNPLDKERWLKIAEHWLQMAQEVAADDGGPA